MSSPEGLTPELQEAWENAWSTPGQPPGAYIGSVERAGEIFSVLREGVSVNQAARKLYAYEETGLTPQEILNLMERERNLTMRVEKLEGWG